MKNIIKLSCLYIGLVIGAGFASGREILEFFNLKNRNDMTGIILAGVLFSFVAYIILIKAKQYNTSNFYEFVDRVSGRAGYYVKAFMFLYMFAGFFVMLSAGGSLCSLEFGCEKKYGIIMLTVLCFIVFVFGAKGIEVLNSVLVPLMILGIFAVCIFSLVTTTAPAANLIDLVKNNFLASAVCYVSYNTINAGAVLVPYSEVLSKKEIKISAAVGGGVLGFLILIVYMTINLYFDRVFEADFPMYEIASLYSDIGRYSYFFVLLMAICTTAASSGFGVLSAFRLNTKTERITASLILCLLAAPFAAFKFSSLVANIYSFFGYVGLLWIIILFKSFLKD